MRVLDKIERGEVNLGYSKNKQTMNEELEGLDLDSDEDKFVTNAKYEGEKWYTLPRKSIKLGTRRLKE